MHGIWHSWISLPWNIWLDYTDKLVKIFAVLIGGVWAYVKFIKGRVFHTRLEPTVEARHFRKDHIDFLLATVRLKNVGASKIDIKQEGTALRVFGCGLLGPNASGETIQWTRTHTLSVFQKHGWIEAAECINDTLLMTLPPNLMAVQVELRVVANKIEWTGKTIVELVGDSGITLASKE